METEIEETYSTRDLSEASMLLVKNQKLFSLERHGKTVYFHFANKENCEELANQFWFGECLVNAKTYYEAMTTLKNRIFANN
jgi:hypothetical protein